MDDGVFLASEGLLQEATFFNHGGVAFDDGETHQAGGDVEGGDDTSGEVQLADDEVEDNAQEKAGDHCPHSYLLRPWRHRRRLECLFHNHLLLSRLFSFEVVTLSVAAFADASLHG